MKVAWRTHAHPTAAHPSMHWLVLSSTLDSSSQTKYSVGIWPYSACQVACNSSFLSEADLEMCLWLNASHHRVWDIVARETSTFQATRSCSCNSSKYRAGLACSNKCMYEMLPVSSVQGCPLVCANGLMTAPYSWWRRNTSYTVLSEQCASWAISKAVLCCSNHQTTMFWRISLVVGGAMMIRIGQIINNHWTCTMKCDKMSLVWLLQTKFFENPHCATPESNTTHCMVFHHPLLHDRPYNPISSFFQNHKATLIIAFIVNIEPLSWWKALRQEYEQSNTLRGVNSEDN